MGRQLHPTRDSTSTVTLSYFQHEELGVCVEVGERRSRLLHQSLAPPAAFPSSPTASHSPHWSPLCFPPSRRPRSLLSGASARSRARLVTLSVIGGLQRWHIATNMPKTRRSLRPHAFRSAMGCEAVDEQSNCMREENKQTKKTRETEADTFFFPKK